MGEALQRYLDEMAASERLTALFRTCSAKLALQADWPDPTADADILKACGADAWRFGLVACLSMLPRAEAWYRTRHIGMDILDATMTDIGLWGANNTARHGMVRFSEFDWIHLHLSCRLFRLGRLQFVLQPYHGDALFLRHRLDRRIAALAMPGVRIRADGYRDGTDGWTEPDSWETVLTKPEVPDDASNRFGFWRGHPVAPDGCTRRALTEYARSEWEIALQPGDDMLDVHIPQGSPLDIEASLASFEQAMPFFRRVFPQRIPRAFHCHSWLLAPQFGRMLPETSNIVRFGNLFYRYPSTGDRQEAWERVFGHHAPTLADAPRESTLQRALHDWLAEGRLLFSMAGMRFPEDASVMQYHRARTLTSHT